MKPPAFPFYVKDWLSGTRRLSFAVKGCYIDLLAWSWDNGPLPATVAEIAKIVGASVAETTPIWRRLRQRQFTKVPRGYINRRLEHERAKSKAFQKLQAEKGRRSAAVRRNRGSNRGSNSVATGRQPALALASALASADRRSPAAKPPGYTPFKVYTAIARRAVEEASTTPTDRLGAIAERFKSICAEQRLEYPPEITRKAVDAVLHPRRRRA